MILFVDWAEAGKVIEAKEVMEDAIKNGDDEDYIKTKLSNCLLCKKWIVRQVKVAMGHHDTEDQTAFSTLTYCPLNSGRDLQHKTCILPRPEEI